MSDAPRKARGRFGLLPLFLAMLAAAAWCAWWFIAADRIDKGLEAQAAALRDRGYDVAWERRRLGGFPFRFRLELEGARLAEPGGWGVAAPRLEAEAAAYAPKVVVLVAPQGLTLSRPDGRTFTITGKAIRASVGGYQRTPPRVSVEGVDLAISPADGGAATFSAIKRFEAHLRPVDGDRAELRLSAEDATARPDSLIGRVAAGAPVSVRLAGTLSQAPALKGSGWPGVVRNWSAAGGAFAIAEGGVRTGESTLTLRPSTITADSAGQASGRLSLALTRASDGILSLGAVGALPEETAAVGAGLAGAAAQPLGLEATLEFRDGRTWLGPLPLGPAPRLY